MFQKQSHEGFCSPADRVQRKTLVYGGQTLMVEIRLEPGGELPLHSHIHEQTGYLVKGKIELLIGDASFTACPGDSWCIKGGEQHGLRTLEESVVVEVFSPVRDEYID
ncbi:MAG: cupin domain-containing protein [Desulfuromonadales bacterium]